MALIQDDDVVKKIATAGADPPLGHTILPGASNRGANRADAQTLSGLQHLTMESVLAIKDQIFWRRIVWEGLTKLLRYPSGRRMASHVAVEDASPVMSNHEEAIQNTESERRHCEEIHRCNRLTMVAQERSPTLGWLGIFRSLPHPPKHGTFRNVEAQHPELAMNPRRAPGAVLGDHAEDMFSQCLARRLPSNYGMFP